MHSFYFVFLSVLRGDFTQHAMALWDCATTRQHAYLLCERSPVIRCIERFITALNEAGFVHTTIPMQAGVFHLCGPGVPVTLQWLSGLSEDDPARFVWQGDKFALPVKESPNGQGKA